MTVLKQDRPSTNSRRQTADNLSPEQLAFAKVLGQCLASRWASEQREKVSAAAESTAPADAEGRQ